jgi:hypothetical protein
LSSGLSIVVDEITPLLARVKSAAAAQGIALVGARAVAGLVKEHLYGLDRQRHRGGRHFYRSAGDSVTTGIVPAGAVVSITQTGFRQRFFGGTIRPRRARMLAIPASPESQGMSPREFPDLDLKRMYDANGAIRLALVRRASTVITYRRRKRKDGTVQLTVAPVMTRLGGDVLFWLVPKVFQRADPTVLPYPAQINQRAVGAIKARFLRLALRQRGGPGAQE